MATRAEDRAFVISEFQSLYGRNPTEFEINHVADALENGTYTRERWIAESQPGGDANATVIRIYTSVVGKPPTDPAGVKYYADRLANGQITQEQMRAEMSAKTAENRQLQGNTTGPTDLNADQKGKENAKAYLDDTLHSYGLDGLSDWAWNEIQAGNSTDRIIQDLRKTPEYKQRFAGMAQRQANGYGAISESSYIQLESYIRQQMHAAGLPPSFYDSPDDFANFIGRDVSPSEIQARITDGYLAASQAPAEVRQQLQALYGVDMNHLAAYFLDPDRALPIIQRQFAAAQNSGIAARTGYGPLNVTEAERLAALGITGQQAEQGFGFLQDARQLFTSLPGEGADSISRDQQQAGVFGGDAGAAALIKKRQESRVSQGSGVGSFALGNSGAAGLAKQN